LKKPDIQQIPWDNNGFTLLEIMLAMMILAVVVSMVSFGLSGSIKAIDGTREQGDVYYRAQVAMERISEDLSAAVLTEHVDFYGGAMEVSTDHRVGLSFASMAHLVFDAEKDKPGLGIIGYAVVQDKDDAQQLMLLRSDVLYRPMAEQERKVTEREAFLLCDRLKSVRFSYFTQEGEEVEAWDTRKKDDEEKKKRQLPAAVQCLLEFWLDRSAGTTLIFSTTVALPTGLIQSVNEQDGQGTS